MDLQLRAGDAEIPIIAISGEGVRGDYALLEDARMLRADVVLSKPFEMAALLSEVETLLSGDRKR